MAIETHMNDDPSFLSPAYTNCYYYVIKRYGPILTVPRRSSLRSVSNEPELRFPVMISRSKTPKLNTSDLIE
jgi:hypothetical protein